MVIRGAREQGTTPVLRKALLDIYSGHIIRRHTKSCKTQLDKQRDTEDADLRGYTTYRGYY